jgi:hypothetical protein
MNLRHHYRSAISERDFRYFETYSARDRDRTIEEAKDRIQEKDLARLKESVVSTPIVKVLGIVSHVLLPGETGQSELEKANLKKKQDIKVFHASINGLDNARQKINYQMNMTINVVETIGSSLKRSRRKSHAYPPLLSKRFYRLSSLLIDARRKTIL